MKTHLHHLVLTLALLALSTFNSQLSTAQAQGTAFTYQGQLNTGTNPANGIYDLRLLIYDSSTGGNILGGPVTNTAVAVTNGLFTTIIDFGAGVFTGSSNWLHIGVRTNGSSAFTGLMPRQQLTPTPYAIYAESAGSTALLNNPGTLNFFAGQNAGVNLSLTGVDNTGVGYGALFTNSSGSYNTAEGVGALSANTGGFFNTAEGAGALFSNTTGGGNTANGFDALFSNTTGNNNTANGSDALFNNTTGGNNVAVGYQALLDNTNQSQNTAIGAQALYANTTGFQDTGLGYQALLNNQSGSENTASGVAALEANLSGSYNTANGAFALNNNTTGANNVANGYQALYYNTNGANNTANGFQTLWQNQNGSANVANGFQALFANLTGSNNVANGFAALNVNNSGSGNVAEGYEALAHNFTGSSNVAVGVLAGANITGSDNIDIGNTGASGDNGIIRIGTPGIHTSTYLAGDVTVSGNLNLPATATFSSGGDSLLAGLAIDPTSQNSGTVGSYALVFGAAVGSSGEGIASDRSSGVNDLEFYTAWANRMTINHDGNVGINTSSPSQALEVNGNYVLIDGGAANNGNGPIDAYIGGSGSGSDVQIGSMNANITGVGFWNHTSGWMSISCSSITIEGGSDLAEPFPISTPEQEVSEGAVVVIDEANPGQLKMSDQPYDTRVVGVISGANGIHPGIQMHQQGLLEGGKNVALTGRVYVQADTSNGAIKPGDLLTTSSTPGRAMRVSDHARAQGAILGKAMTALNEGKGMVLVLVTLQ